MPRKRALRDEREADVVRAATAVFLRYGFARTTMGDLATEAKISRPALYLFFPSKELAFAAVVRRMDADWHAEIVAGLRKHATLEGQLRYACGSWAAHGVTTMAKHPDARDLFDLSFEAVREMYEHFQSLIADLMSDAVAAAGFPASSKELARSLMWAMRGIKEAAATPAEMSRLAEVQIELLIAALQVPLTSKSRRRG